MRYSNLQALVVHIRPYRETSAMVQFFTRENGRLTGVMKGLHRGRRQQHIQTFDVGTLACYGRTELLTVTQFEKSRHIALQGDALSAGFYVFELLTRCVAERQAEARIFDAVLAVLEALSREDLLAPCLRRFEQMLLKELGYGYDFRHEAHSGMSIMPQGIYKLVSEQGFVPEPASQGAIAAGGDQELTERIPGWVLLAIADSDFTRLRVQKTARLIHQHVLAPLLGPAPLLSRALYKGSARG